MEESPGRYSSIDSNVAINLREHREVQGLSQEDLAQRMTERGFGFSQATIWKIEQGKRPVKISEVAALADCLGLRIWTTLVLDPARSRHHGQLQRANKSAYQAYQQLKAAASEYIEAQIGLAFAVRSAQDDGEVVAEHWRSWLQIPAERGVIEARIQADHEEAEAERVDTAVDQVLTALRQYGYDGTLDPQDLEIG